METRTFAREQPVIDGFALQGMTKTEMGPFVDRQDLTHHGFVDSQSEGLGIQIVG